MYIKNESIHAFISYVSQMHVIGKWKVDLNVQVIDTNYASNWIVLYDEFWMFSICKFIQVVKVGWTLLWDHISMEEMLPKNLWKEKLFKK